MTKLIFFFLLFTILKSIILLHYFLWREFKNWREKFYSPWLAEQFCFARNRKLIIYSFFSARRRHTCLQLQWNVTSVVEFPLFIWILYTANPKPVRLTGNSLLVNSHREKPVFIAGILFSLQGFPCKILYFPVWDCSDVIVGPTTITY